MITPKAKKYGIKVPMLRSGSRLHVGTNEAGPNGFMALVTVVIIAAVALLMSLNSSFLGLSALDMSFLANEGGRATALAEGCAETALRELRINPAYTGVASPGLSLFGGSCIIEVTNLGGNNRQATTTAMLGNFTKRIVLTATLDLGTRSLMVNGWQEF